MLFSKLNTFVNSLKKRGVWATLQFVLYEYLFDFLHKVNTRGYVDLTTLNVTTDIKYATIYQGSNYYILNKFFKIYQKLVKNSTVIDFGSGKGRILILAIKYGAKSCIGVEFAKELIDISLTNLESYKLNNSLKTEIELIHDSALNYEFDETEDFIFFYNPFNEKILNPILQKILQLHTRPFIVYINPVHKELFTNEFEEVDNFNNDLIVYQKKAVDDFTQ